MPHCYGLEGLTGKVAMLKHCPRALKIEGFEASPGKGTFGGTA